MPTLSRDIMHLCLRLVAVTVILGLTVTNARAQLRPDHHVMFQDTYLGAGHAGELDPYIFDNAAWSMGGWGLQSQSNFTITQFIDRTDAQIRSAIQNYINVTTLDANTSDLVMLDIEWPIKPRDWGQTQHDAIRDDYLNAVRRRVEIAREELPNARLGFFAIIQPPAFGNASQAWLDTTYAGYQRAGELGVYDDLDVFVPQIYAPFGATDPSFWSIGNYTHAGITYTQALTDSLGQTRPVVPLFSFHNHNGSSLHNGELHATSILSEQIHIAYGYSSVESVAIWTANADALDIPAYLDALGMRIGDVTQDGSIDLDDVDALRDAIAGEGSGTQTAWFADVNQDDQIDSEDMRHLVQDILNYTPGDANLDGIVNGLDLSALASHWQAAGIWQDADFTGDGVVNGLDLSALAGNWQANAAGAGTAFDDAVTVLGSIPEPTCAVLLLGGFTLIVARRCRA